MSIGQAPGAATNHPGQATVVDPTRTATRSAALRPAPSADADGTEDPAQRQQRRAAFYEERASRWSGLLSASFSEIAGEMSFDFGQRMDSVLSEAERKIDSCDPFKNWTDFARGLDRRLTEEAWNNYQVAVDAVRALSVRSARHLELDETEVIDPPPPSVYSALATSAPSETAHQSGRLSAMINIIMRGYMGFMMLLILSNTVLKISLSVWFGALPFGFLAAVAWREERGRRLAARRSEARRLTRSHVEDFGTRAMKDAQDLLRALEQGLGQAYRLRVERQLAAPGWR